MRDPSEEHVDGDTDLDWPDEKPIGIALEDIEEGGLGRIEVTPEFLMYFLHLETHGFKRLDLEEKK